MTRRDLLKKIGLASLSLESVTGLLPWRIGIGAPTVRKSRQNLRISRIIVQNAPGRRATPVAPNAFAAYRGYEVDEPLIRIQTNQGIEGITRVLNPEEREPVLRQLVGLDPFELFDWENDRYAGPAAAYDELVRSLRGVDIALFDIIGKATDRPVADVLGSRVRSEVDVYDSSLYMEDLLAGEQLGGLAYLDGQRPPPIAADMVARKAEWLTNVCYRDEGIRIFKIKTGRAKWMDSYREALQRDIDVFKAVRMTLGNDYTLFADVNNGYDRDHTAAITFITETSDCNVFGIEEMFQEKEVDHYQEVKEHVYDLGLNVRMIDGEGHGIPFELLAERFNGPQGEESLFDVNNPSFSHVYGFVDVHEVSQESQRQDVLVAPHNFASKIGFYASVHMSLSQPNWAFCETDDSAFPGIRAPGVEIVDGRARLTGVPGLGVVVHEEHLDQPALVIEP